MRLLGVSLRTLRKQNRSLEWDKDISSQLVFHWCPNGCGKCVFYDYLAKRLYCRRCKRFFRSVQVEKVCRKVLKRRGV